MAAMARPAVVAPTDIYETLGDPVTTPLPLLDAAAVNSRLPANEMTTSETAVFSHYALAGLADYCYMRNWMLHTWLSDPTRRLDLTQCLNAFPESHAMVRDIYLFLERNCYINFGYLPLDAAPQGKSTVIVIGAGAAGLTAARQLRLFGMQVTVVEARDRIGGRMWTHPLRGDDVEATHGGSYQRGVDLGASIITGLFAGNPLLVLSRQLKLNLIGDLNACPLFLARTGHEAPSELDALVEERYNRMLDETAYLRADLTADIPFEEALAMAERRLGGIVGIKPEEKGDADALLAWHKANLEFANATTLAKLSTLNWDQDDQWAVTGTHAMVEGGYGRVVTALAEGLNIVLNKVVTQITHSNSGCSVKMEDGSVMTADRVLVAVPLGVLKSNLVTFQPPLSAHKAGAIQRIGFGAINKLALRFETAFWETTPHTKGMPLALFGIVLPPNHRGLHYLTLNATRLLGKPTLLLITSGQSAITLENMGKSEAVASAMQSLRAVFPDAPDPTDAVLTGWAKDPYSRGSYSSMAPGSTGGDYDTLAMPVGRTLFFAGEATNRCYPATVHGAILSGLREAARIGALVLRTEYSLPQHAEVTEFSTTLQCLWHNCGRTLRPHESLRGHIIKDHLSSIQRIDYFTALDALRTRASQPALDQRRRTSAEASPSTTPKRTAPEMKRKGRKKKRFSDGLPRTLRGKPLTPGSTSATLTPEELALCIKYRYSEYNFSLTRDRILEVIGKLGVLSLSEMRKHVHHCANRVSVVYRHVLNSGAGGQRAEAEAVKADMAKQGEENEVAANDEDDGEDDDDDEGDEEEDDDDEGEDDQDDEEDEDDDADDNDADEQGSDDDTAAIRRRAKRVRDEDYRAESEEDDDGDDEDMVISSQKRQIIA